MNMTLTRQLRSVLACAADPYLTFCYWMNNAAPNNIFGSSCAFCGCGSCCYNAGGTVNNDFVSVQISPNGSTWTTAWGPYSGTNGPSWQNVAFSMPLNTQYVRFLFTSDNGACSTVTERTYIDAVDISCRPINPYASSTFTRTSTYSNTFTPSNTLSPTFSPTRTATSTFSNTYTPTVPH